MDGFIERFTKAELLGIISAIVVFVGSFLPQVKVVVMEPKYSEFWHFGIERGSVFIFVFLVAFTLAIIYFCDRYHRKSLSSIFMIALGATILLFMNNQIASWTGWTGEDSFIEIQIGSYLPIIGGIGLIISGLWLLFTPGKEKIYCRAGNIFSAIAFLLGIIIFIPMIFFMRPYIEAMSPITTWSAISFETYIGGWVFLFLSPLLMCSGIIDYLVSRKYPTVEEAVEKIGHSERIAEDENAMKILRVRYVKGEITKEEYEQMKKDIEQ
ncbi:MAG: SHOCT domain-containing protein [Actinobacteria bacterium]|nr:SHOCT domain-containing protein [Actinomycetota bacterium]MBE3120617.1 SHOCT domain-containing protein [Thermoplasmata archaeon]